jgi:ubiquitin carboxyl-terminal hydrolase 4/11/15
MKINSMVDYPTDEMNFDKFMTNEEAKGKGNFLLAGVICHSGSLRGGHYWMFGRNFNDGHWYNFNDSSRSIMYGDEICS